MRGGTSLPCQQYSPGGRTVGPLFQRPYCAVLCFIDACQRLTIYMVGQTGKEYVSEAEQDNTDVHCSSTRCTQR